MHRSYRKQIAQNTLALIKRGHFVNKKGKVVNIGFVQQKAEEQTKLYYEKELNILVKNVTDTKKFLHTTYKVYNETSLNAVRELNSKGAEKIFCLNFASAKNPGGGFLNGSQAQEESIARATGLYPCLLKAPEYYQLHRSQRSCFYTDTMIYSPDVPIFKGENGELLAEIVPVTILTSAAVNAGAVKRQEAERIKEIPKVMKGRIDKVLAIAHHYGHEVLVLGAWGCGVFANDPAMIAQLFYQSLTTTFAGKFKQVVFAIKSKQERFRLPFEQLFI